MTGQPINILPGGLYDFTFVEFDLRETLHLHATMYLAKLQLVGYEFYVWDTFADLENASWKWKQFDIEEFDRMPTELEGATFLCEYEHIQYSQQDSGRIKEYIARKIES
jgi:hypothetical protein